MTYFSCTLAQLREYKTRHGTTVMEQQDKEKQVVFDYWWGIPIDNLFNPQPSPWMLAAMEALYASKRVQNPGLSVEDMCKMLPEGAVQVAQQLGDKFDKYTAHMKPEEQLEYLVAQIQDQPDEDEPAAKRRKRHYRR